MRMFTTMFSDYFTNFDVPYQSLSPKFNRNQVFRASEGAGRSGSFFFFSNDNKFIIKTIPKEELKEVLRLNKKKHTARHWLTKINNMMILGYAIRYGKVYKYDVTIPGLLN